MATSGTISFSLVDGNTEAIGTIYWARNGNNISVYAKADGYADTYRNTQGAIKFSGNNAEYMSVSVDGTSSTSVLVCSHYSNGASAAASSPGWFKSITGATTSTVSRPMKTGAYSIVVSITGNGGKTATYSVTCDFTWAVTYYGNGNTGGSTAAQTKSLDVALSIRACGFTRDKYVFLYWTTAANGTGTVYNPGDSYTGNAALNLYAQWKKANIPVYANVSGAVKQVEKAYANIGGTVKEVTIYTNVGGVIKELI